MWSSLDGKAPARRKREMVYPVARLVYVLQKFLLESPTAVSRAPVVPMPTILPSDRSVCASPSLASYAGPALASPYAVQGNFGRKTENLPIGTDHGVALRRSSATALPPFN
jgi:hypothetical protein